MSRALATVERVSAIRVIPNADSIELVKVRDWHVIAKKGEFDIDDACVYFEIDSMLDVTDPRFAFLASRGVKTNDEGFEGHVLKSIKLRGTLSQGLVLPIKDFPELRGIPIGNDVTDTLNVHKWEPPNKFVYYNHETSKPRPQFVPKTDEERIQNVGYLIDSMDASWIATEKIDGTSLSVYTTPTTHGVCSRNYEVADEPDSPYWQIVHELGLIDWMRSAWPLNVVVVQGELYGPRIQGNPLGVSERRLAVFNLFIDGQYIDMADWPEWLDNVPVLNLPVPQSVEQALEDVNGMKSVVNSQRLAEGVVWRKWPMSFKAINNKFLLKSKD